jgi:cell wall-associated NlpC family hydrolase
MNVRALTGIALGAAISMASACASTGVRPQPFPTPPERPESPPTEHPLTTPGASLGDGFTIAGAALRLQGLPYRLGGSDPRGFDCSGFVQYVFALYGTRPARVGPRPVHVGPPGVARRSVPGDLGVFVTQGDEVSHVGIVIGGDRFVHAPTPGRRPNRQPDVRATGANRVAGARRMDWSAN